MSAPSVSDSLPSLALLAGGLATRLRPITASIPKSLVEVAGEPFIAHQLRLLVSKGISDVVVCTGYLGERIEAFVGDGNAFGCRVQYSSDGDKPLGTGGALRHALPLLGPQFFVMYGDSYLDTSLRPIFEAFLAGAKPALMTVFHNSNRWDTSNVEFIDGLILRYDKVNRTPDMHYIDYGLGVFSADALRQHPDGLACDLSSIYSSLAERHQLAGYEVHERFYEIGSHMGLKELDAYLRKRANALLT